MKSDEKKYNKSFYHFLYIVAKWFTLMPPIIKLDQIQYSFYFSYYLILTITFSLALGYDLYIFITIINREIQLQTPTSFVYHILAQITGPLIGISLTMLSINNFKTFQNLSFLVNTIDKLLFEFQLDLRVIPTKINKLFLICSTAYLVFCMVFGFTLIKKFGFADIFHIAFKIVQGYAEVVALCLIINFCAEIKIRFRVISKLLKKIFEETPDSENMHSVINIFYLKRKEQTSKLLKIAKAYKLNSKLVDMFNLHFGIPILMMFFYFLIRVINFLNMVILMYLFEKIHVHMISLVYLSMRIFTAMIMVIVVVVTCEKTTRSAQSIATTCYKLLLDVPPICNTMQERILKDELILLTQQAIHRCSYFSAAGFFKIDYSMVFGLLGTITFYVIVLIQINK